MVEISALLRNDKGIPAKVRWHLNRWLLRHLALVNAFHRARALPDDFPARAGGRKARNKPAQGGARNERSPGSASLNRRGLWLTVHDAFGAPGDTLLTAIICRHIAEHFSSLRINCITPNPELLQEDPHIHQLNGPETYLSLRHWYLELIEHKHAEINVLDESMRAIGINTCNYRASVYLTDKERTAARERLGVTSRPLISINTRSKEPVKNWPAERWHRLAALLQADYDLIQLGDGTELKLDGARSFAGQLTFRESMALLSHATAHIGPDSFLMHAANGLRVPSAILFGGSRTPANLGYADNINLYVPMPCGPCYIHQSRGETCAHGIECMNRISVDEVYAAVTNLIGQGQNKSCK